LKKKTAKNELAAALPTSRLGAMRLAAVLLLGLCCLRCCRSAQPPPASADRAIRRIAFEDVDPLLLDVVRRAAATSHAAANPHPNLVFASVVNYGFRELALNLQRSAARVGLRQLFFYALDASVREYLLANGAPFVYLAPSNLTAGVENGAAEFRTSKYSRVVGFKVQVARQVLALGFDAFLLDADVVLLRNPLNFLVDAPLCDLAVTTDSSRKGLLVPGESRFAGENFERGPVRVLMNTGVILYRNTADTRRLLDKFSLSRYRVKPPNVGDDQLEFNRFMGAPAWPVKVDGREVPVRPDSIDRDFVARASACSVYHNVTMFVLPPALFPNTAQALHLALPDRFSLAPYLVHFTNAGTMQDKGLKMKEMGLWWVA
jgi:hypothetical protein